MAKKLARLPISTAAKIKTIIAKIMPVAMYGVEAANPSDKAIARLTAALLDCLVGTAKPRDMDAILSRYAVRGVDLDPVVQILVRRTMALRRCLATRPANKALVQRMVSQYRQEAGVGVADVPSGSLQHQPQHSQQGAGSSVAGVSSDNL